MIKKLSQKPLGNHPANMNHCQIVNHTPTMNQPTGININIFKLTVNNLKSVQKTKNQIGNKIYGALIEDTLHSSPYIGQIRALRQDKNADKKTTAKLIKKAIDEAGLMGDVVDDAFVKAKKDDVFYNTLDKLENNAVKQILTPDLAKMPVYTGYLSQIKGMGVITSAQLIAIIGDITRFPKPSNMLTYFGCGNPEDSTPKKGVQANYNPKAKSLVLGVIGDNFIKQRSPYRVVYDKRMAQTKKTHPEWHHLNPDGTKATGKNMHPKHGYRDGVRVMMKRFLIEAWVASYQAKGLNPPTEPYILTQPHHNKEPQIVAYSQPQNVIHIMIASQSSIETHTHHTSYSVSETHKQDMVN